MQLKLAHSVSAFVNCGADGFIRLMPVIPGGQQPSCKKCKQASYSLPIVGAVDLAEMVFAMPFAIRKGKSQ